MKNVTKMGRPPKDPSEKLSKGVTVRMTEDEYRDLTSELGDRSISEALRLLIFGGGDKKED